MTYAPALAQRWFPQRTWLREGAVVCGGALLIAVLAQAALPLAPVPVTLQTLGVLLVGGWLGFRRAVTAVALYIAAGASGLPVFALGRAGVAVLAGPTAGYLIGFLAAAGTVGLLGEHGFLRRFSTSLLTMLLACLPIYAFGLAWLSTYGLSAGLLEVGFWPFVLGDLAKAGAAAAVFPLLLSASARSAR